MRRPRSPSRRPATRRPSLSCTRPGCCAPGSPPRSAPYWTWPGSATGRSAGSARRPATRGSPRSATTTGPPSRPSRRCGRARAKSSRRSGRRPGSSARTRRTTTCTPCCSTPASRRCSRGRSRRTRTAAAARTVRAARRGRAGAGAPAPGVRLPLSLGEIDLAPSGDRALWAHGTVTRDDGRELLADLALYDAEDGTPLGRVSGFRAADIDQVSTTVSRATVDSWLALPEWVPLPGLAPRSDAGNGEEAAAYVGEATTRDGGLPAAATADAPAAASGAAPEPGAEGPRDWLVLADTTGLADAFAALVRERGDRCRLVRPGPGYAREETGDVTLAPEDPVHLDRLFAELDGEGAPFRGEVVHLWNLGLPGLAESSGADIGTATARGAWTLVALARVLRARRDTCRLHVVTRGAQPVAAGDAVEPLGAPAWGVTRVLRHQELARHRGKLVDLDPVRATPPDEAAALLAEFLADDEEEIGLRGNTRATLRLQPAAPRLTGPLPPRLRPDGTYLVTGAFGALGRLLCRTLVRRGARRLVLLGRTPLPPRAAWRTTAPEGRAGQAIALVREIEALGASVVLAPVDLTDEAAFTGWLATYRAGDPPPLRGVFHLAGQVRDTLLADIDRAAFDTVHAPKTTGAHLLDKHLRDEPLEHFVLFASVASLLTTAGQTNYAAGNAFLDALAHRRRAAGLPALSLDWGPWATGMIEELGLEAHYLHSRGMSSLSPEAGMSVLERVLGQDLAQLVVATVVDWRTFLAWYDTPPALVQDLAASAGDRAAEDEGDLLAAFRAAGPEERRALVAERFTRLVATVLRAAPEEIDPAGGLGAHGLDSLLAMELRARSQAELGVAPPVVALLSDTPVAELAARLHEELTERLAQDTPEGAGTVELWDDDGDFPLTQNQKALWFLKQLNPEGHAYNIGGAVEVRAELDPELMFAAVRRLVARHPALRTGFHLREGRPVQRIGDGREPDLGWFDVEGQEWEEIKERIIHEYRAGYDLEQDALFRFRLFRRGPDRWVIMKAVHHIVSDAVSTFTFIEELLEVYEALKEGREPALAPVPARYVDFLNQQNKFLASPEAARMRDYWRAHLPAEVPLLDLPTDRPRPAVQTHNGASEFFVLDETLSARVHTLAQRHGVTPFMVLLATYYVLLHRWSGQDDLVVGSPVTGRTRQEFSSVYGYFVNPLPLHADLSGDPAVEALLGQVRDTVLGGLDHQEYPFVLLVDELGLQHDSSRSAVFQAMFILLTHKVATEQYGYRLEYIELPEEEGQFDLTLSAYEEEAEGRFHCVLKYNTDLFDAATVRRMAAHYTRLLDSLVHAESGTPVSALDMLAAHEREELVRETSGAARAALEPGAVPVHRLFARAARENPSAVAVRVPGGDALSYGALDARSAGLADRLRALGIGAGSVVGVALPKSPELVVHLLAVLRAGGAYLPLDPALPAGRLARVLAGAGAALLITEGAAPEGLPCRSLAAGALAAQEPLPAAETADDLDAPAYVIHTSGSTGEPKAVRVAHRNLAAAYASWHREYRLGEEVRVHLQSAQPSFDVFTGDLVRALCSGGTLVLAGRDLLLDTARLYTVLREERVDCAEFVPALVRGLMDHCVREGLGLGFLRLLVVGSDTWKVAEYERLRRLAGPGTRVLNSYGVTEATIDSAFFEGPADGLDPGLAVPVGRPLPHATLHVLDPHGNPLPAGITGELWIGGEGVALGYAGRPGLTAERFTERELLPGAGAERLYRTGDLARWDTAGRLHLLGRADSQVKLRGHRIETGEIEAHLAARRGIARAVVAVRPGAGGEDALCAWYVPEPGAEVSPAGLRRALADALPSYLVPAYLTEVGALPLTAHGKVDVRALPAPSASEARSAYEAPVTLYEVSMAAHWKALLGLEEPGLADDFFASGGSSIKLIELLHHLRTEFGVGVPVSRLYQVTTLHGMAAAVEERVTGTTADEVPHLTFNPGAERPLFCFPPAGGHGLVYRGLAAALPDHRLIAFNYLPGDDKVSRYADLVTAAVPKGPVPLLGYSLGGNLAFEVARELEARGREIAHVVVLDSRRSLKAYEPGPEVLKAFESELGGHLHQHTGSEIVTAAVMEHAAEYLRFCGRTPNTGTLAAPVSVLTDEDKADLYEEGVPGSWHGSSAAGHRVLCGFGTHAEMLDAEHLPRNAQLVRRLLDGQGAA
ncbi:non-ribosomal peptide synthetase [Streptomyces sp. SPB074]|nr:non-ribosomal peptide synthetase [Streptomyces sp. SPB074]